MKDHLERVGDSDKEAIEAQKIGMSASKVILVVDSGSTKSDWLFLSQGEVLADLHLGGMNPYFRTATDTQGEILSILPERLRAIPLRSLYFYGAGCTSAKIDSVRAMLQACFKVEDITVCSDMLGAARALCGHERGVACILGTGSASCLYDGERIAHSIPSLGYILGDEGSGASLGRLLLGEVFKNRLPVGIKESFVERFGMDEGDVEERVYRQPLPNRFLARVSTFLSEHISETWAHDLLFQEFRRFFVRCVKPYNQASDVAFAGSIAWFYRDILSEVAEGEGIRLGKIIRRPIEGLLKYHVPETY